jgi:DeoR/GlpR family transcriptional regulator of sugar metabolism
MRWAEQQRQKFILERVQECAEINRSDLTDHFGISVQQASIDLKKFQQANPEVLTYDKSRKRYVATAFQKQCGNG